MKILQYQMLQWKYSAAWNSATINSAKSNSVTSNKATLKATTLNSGALYKKEFSWQLNIIAVGIMRCNLQLHIEVQTIMHNKFKIKI